MKNIITRALLSIALAIPLTYTTGCGIAPTGGINNPTDTPQYRIQKSLLIIADANKATVQLVIQLNASKVLNDSITREILTYNAAVAQFAKTATTTMQSGASNADKAASIQALVRTLPLPANIKAFVDSAHPEAVAAAVAGIVAVQNTIALLTGSLGSL